MPTAIIWLSLTAWAAPDFDFTISTDYDKPFPEHIQWCLDHKITSEALAFDLPIPDKVKQNQYLDSIRVYFEPNDLVPQQVLTLGIEDTHETSINEWDDIEAFMNKHEAAVIDWLQVLTSKLSGIYSSSRRPIFRYRLYNEVNSFKLFEPEHFYLLLRWFYDHLSYRCGNRKY